MSNNAKLTVSFRLMMTDTICHKHQSFLLLAAREKHYLFLAWMKFFPLSNMKAQCLINIPTNDLLISLMIWLMLALFNKIPWHETFMVHPKCKSKRGVVVRFYLFFQLSFLSCIYQVEIFIYIKSALYNFYICIYYIMHIFVLLTR